MKHNAYTYKNGYCRCEVCASAHTVYEKNARRARRNSRVLIDGRWVAPLRDDQHGKSSSYSNYSCRCVKCTEAWGVDRRARLARRAEAEA